MYANSPHTGLERIEEVRSQVVNTALLAFGVMGLPD